MPCDPEEQDAIINASCERTCLIAGNFSVMETFTALAVEED